MPFLTFEIFNKLYLILDFFGSKLALFHMKLEALYRSQLGLAFLWSIRANKLYAVNGKALQKAIG